MGSKGFSYTIADDKLREYMKLSTEDKLRWLDEISTLTEQTLSTQEKKIRELFRTGEL